MNDWNVIIKLGLTVAIYIINRVWFKYDNIFEAEDESPYFFVCQDMMFLLQGFRFFSRLVGRSDPWSKHCGPFSEMMGPSILN